MLVHKLGHQSKTSVGIPYTFEASEISMFYKNTIITGTYDDMENLV
jgi:hypothetical protein